MEQGLVRAGGNNEKILREIEFGFAEATPTNAEEAHNLVKYAAAEVQLIPGEPKVAADGTIILMNLGVMTTLGLDGSILVTRGNDVLLYLIP